MNCLVFGGGKMGLCIVEAMQKLGYIVAVADSREALDEDLDKDVRFYCRIDAQCTEEVDEVIEDYNPQIIISALPYYHCFNVARASIDNNVSYCDLGGSVPTSKRINDYAQEQQRSIVMTDLGLAPGWVNIIAEEAMFQLGGATDIHMMTGGLPARPMLNDPLNYVVTWSVDGLINEYKDKCKVLKNGVIQTIPCGLSGLENITIPGWESHDFEVFYTSGGASHSILSMKNRGVLNCSYKTIRYKGHCDIVNFLIHSCKLNNEQLKAIFTYNEGRKIQDIVIIYVKAMKGKLGQGRLTWEKTKMIYGDSRWTAMQIATAYPLAATADLIVQGGINNYKFNPYSLGYDNIRQEAFNRNLKKLGI